MSSPSGKIPRYETTKTIRFQAIPLGDVDKKSVLGDIFCVGREAIGEEDALLKEREIVSEFLVEVKSFWNEIHDIVFFTSPKSGEDVLRKEVEIKKKWLKMYLKQSFFDSLLSSVDGKITEEKNWYRLTEVKFLLDEMNRCRLEWETLVREMQTFVDAPEENQLRRRKFAQTIRFLKARRNFPFLRDMVGMIGGEEKGIIEKIRNVKSIAEQLEKKMNEVERVFLPSQTAGLCVAKGSFNYYTIQKDPKDIDEERKSVKKLLEAPLSGRHFQIKKKNLKKKNREGGEFSLDDGWFKSAGFSDDEISFLKEKSLDDVYFFLKQWKAEKKSAFSEMMQEETFRGVLVENKQEESTDIPALVTQDALERVRGYKFQSLDVLGAYLGIEKKEGKYEKPLSEGELLKQYVCEKFSLFDVQDKQEADLLEYLRLTREIARIGTEKNDLLQSGRSEEASEVYEKDEALKVRAQARGRFFNFPDNERHQTERYWELNEFFKNIAKSRGEAIAKISGIEEEQRESQLLKFWNFFLEEEGKFFLVLVPREKRLEARNFLCSLSETRDVATVSTLHAFDSLTFRALRKLCFKECGNTFFPEIIRELRINRNRERDIKTRGMKNDLSPGFYQDILETNFARNNLGLSKFPKLRDVLSKHYEKENLQEFESDLERACYIRRSFSLNGEQKEKLLKKCGAVMLEITSQDLRIAFNGENTTDHRKKAHTELWENFWKEENKNTFFPIRINPEIKIFYREADEELQKKESEGLIYQPVKLSRFENRFRENRFTVALTISENATEQKSALAFKTTDDLKRYIEDFNKKFNETFSGKWLYGIDRGLKELATLCVMKFSDTETYEVNGTSFPKPEFAKIPVWEIKNTNEKRLVKSRYDDTVREFEVGKNISYFIDREDCQDIFEKKEVACIDLTTAKLVRGRIVLNGDTNTYFKLKELSARRRLWELFSHGLIDGESKLEKNWNVLRVMTKAVDEEGKQKWENVYWLRSMQESDAENVTAMLTTYVSDICKRNAVEDIEGINKIIHLHEAIVANMIGIVVFLQKSFDMGGIFLENLHSKKHLEEDFRQSNEVVHRKVELSLYRKFQSSGLVPPQIKQSVFVREELLMDQFGIIRFVSEENTSTMCPRCEATHKKTSTFKKNKRKGIFICEACGFDTSDPAKRFEFSALTNNDEMAAYNIAKR